ncbi:DUF971 domain-containing protein [Mycobacterium sp. KBS0706]|jgi:DUF971 family protein|uniref:gamma-butyrobetaine hydroxylase-like domain-containing protein n=1 Tax=Mycobacterium sp. KBS0706 TaxID=2578109 RepID=UPI00110F82D2|nr:DUF971 domain-containing protein [Mycobacterium sp. KBS0706]TSD82952.1 DUF971 domain-containing protein [Mycobacterium sp. KBS0706]
MSAMGSPPLTGSAARPVEIRLKRAERVLELRFDDGLHVTLSAELLRVESPSAEVQGHGPSQKTIVGGKRNVAITAVEPVGHYAIRLVFDDGHDTGLYSWTWLHELATRQDELWRAYLAALEARGLSRDR